MAERTASLLGVLRRHRWQVAPACVIRGKRSVRDRHAADGLSSGTVDYIRSAAPSGLAAPLPEALDASRRERHICLVSGSEEDQGIFLRARTIETLIRDSSSRILVLRPEDRISSVPAWERALETAGLAIPDAGEDGLGTPAWRRRHLENGRLFVLSPEAVHRDFLGRLHRPEARRLIARVRHVVLESLHAFDGPAGCHAALLLRRLRFAVDALGGSLTFSAAAFPIHDPAGHCRRLTGLPFETIEGSDRPKRRIAVFHARPPADAKGEVPIPTAALDLLGIPGTGPGTGPGSRWRTDGPRSGTVFLLDRMPAPSFPAPRSRTDWLERLQPLHGSGGSILVLRPAPRGESGGFLPRLPADPLAHPPRPPCIRPENPLVMRQHARIVGRPGGEVDHLTGNPARGSLPSGWSAGGDWPSGFEELCTEERAALRGKRRAARPGTDRADGRTGVFRDIEPPFGIIVPLGPQPAGDDRIPASYLGRSLYPGAVLLLAGEHFRVVALDMKARRVRLRLESACSTRPIETTPMLLAAERPASSGQPRGNETGILHDTPVEVTRSIVGYFESDGSSTPRKVAYPLSPWTAISFQEPCFAWSHPGRAALIDHRALRGVEPPRLEAVARCILEAYADVAGLEPERVGFGNLADPGVDFPADSNPICLFDTAPGGVGALEPLRHDPILRGTLQLAATLAADRPPCRSIVAALLDGAGAGSRPPG